MANKRLNATITIGGALSGTLKSALGTTKNKLTDIGAEVRKLTREQRMLAGGIDTFGRMGKNVDSLRARYAAVTAEIEKTRRAQARLQAHQNAKENFGQATGRMGRAVAIGAATAGAVFFPIKNAIAFENAMLGVAKQLEGARDEAGKLTPKYYEMAAGIQQLGRELPTSTNAIAEMVTAGLRMGVASDEILDFVRNASAMATAFELPEGELAEQMGKIAGLYKIPIPAIGQLADSINFLDDNAISKGGDIIEFLTRTGGVAGAIKITGTQMAALGSTMLTMGESTETASTSVNAMFAKLASATKGTKKFRSAMNEVGLSLEKVQNGMQLDAIGTMQTVFDAIAKQDPSKHLGLLVEMFGQEHAPKLVKLVTGVEELRKQLALADSEAAKGSMGREFAARMETATAQWEITKNRVVEFSVAIGSALLPAINSIMNAIGPVVSAMADWAKENPNVTKTVVGLVGGLVVLGIAGAALGVVISGLGVILTGLAIVATTIGLVIGAVAIAIGAAAFLIVKYWEPIKAFFVGLWGGVVSAGKMALAWVTDVFLTFHPLGMVIANWDPIKTYFTGLWADITATARNALQWIISKIDAIGAAWQKTKAFFGGGDTPAAGSTVTPPEGGTAGERLRNRKLPTFPALPKPAMKSSSAAPVAQTNTYNITQLPGENAQQLAERVAKINAQKNAVQQRGRLTDAATG